MRRVTRVQLTAFVLVSVLAIGYGAVRYLDAGHLVSPPYEVSAEFAGSGGVYPRANVELLGAKVGEVTELRPGPGTGTTVVMAVEEGVQIPRAVEARIRVKSAIGEQYVELTPTRAGAPHLRAGDVIPVAATQTPVDTATLLEHVDALMSSVDPGDLGTVLDELSTGLSGGSGPATEQILDDSAEISKVALDNVEEINSLIDNARTVLDTQADLAPTTSMFLEQIAGLLSQLEAIDPEIGEVFTQGVRAGTELNGLLSANSSAIALLLDDTLHTVEMLDARLPSVRKLLVMLPWIQESVSAVFRYCDEIDPKTAEPVKSSCHYDQHGRPLYSAYVGLQLPEVPGRRGGQSYFPCTEGYEGTTRYLPDGTPLEGDGPPQEKDADPNLEARCTVDPTDPVAPDVRGSQNVEVPGTPRVERQHSTQGSSAPQIALYDPTTHTVATPDGTVRMDTSAPPSAAGDRLGWLLTGAMRGER
ncbi:MCE family protein [Nocardioides sp. NPDC059952]|uniref:MCE family protein n=1 Tax=Nocardioides sp. NPDC059952 TaxID=3347014 RepID=UPI003648AF9C